MILLGAGSSIPFDIPGMRGFTDRFFAEHKEKSDLINNIRDAIEKSGEIIGISFSFDLETLLSVLNDLSGVKPEKPISIATASLLITEGLNTKTARKEYEDEASSTLDKLTEFIFKTCMEPIRKGRKEGNFGFLNSFYGPLMTVLNKVDMKNIQDRIRRVYSTNWDLCFKTWVDYVNIPVHDGTEIDKQSFPVLDIGKRFDTSAGFNYVPLHGSIDLIKILRLKGEGAYEDIFKLSDPIRYFEDKPANVKNVFIVYPLEAIGYEESIRSPYLDMLNYFRSSLKEEQVIFIIGYSLRDPIIGSIFEEVVAERIRKGDLAPLSENLDSRKSEVSAHKFKIVVINPEPERLVENLKKQFNTNLLQTFVPIKIEFPILTEEKFDTKYRDTLLQLIADLVHMRYMSTDEAERLTNILGPQYNIAISPGDFPWKKR
jgi:hypothetical protein